MIARPVLTAPECRERIVRHLRGRGWVSIADLARWMGDTLHVSRNQGSADLRDLVLTGQLERRDTAEPGCSWLRKYEYRVPPRARSGHHSGRPRVQRRLAQLLEER